MVVTFRPSPSQVRAVRAVTADLKRQTKKKRKAAAAAATAGKDADRDAEVPPVIRVIMGDVGTGKTLVAAAALAHCTGTLGRQAAVMAPTEALARQQYDNFTNKYGLPGPPHTQLLRGPTSTKDNRNILEQVADGRTSILVGTTGITAARFRDLALLVVDEQQKFGVEARNALAQDNAGTVTILLTATPIPRTMKLMADLRTRVKTSTIQHQRGRTDIGKPRVTVGGMDRQERQKIYQDISKRMRHRKKYKAYLVFSAVTESPQGDILPLRDAVETTAEAMGGPELIAVLHGRMKREVQEQEMERFRSGRARVLMASSVIEVGIHDQDATDIVIHDADRFGASQLHQIIGRVGRTPETAKRARCMLLTRRPDAPAVQAVVQPNRKGEDVAQRDLQQRGPGDLSGTLQKGDYEAVLAPQPPNPTKKATKTTAKKNTNKS